MEKVKLFFELNDNIDGIGTESIWTRPGSMGGLIIENTPFYIEGVSFLDEVSYKVKNGVFYFDKIINKSGHSTYRILQLSNNPKEKFDQYWEPIHDLGASYESRVDGNRTLYAVDVPANVDIKTVYDLLDSGEKNGIWHFEEADYGS